MDNSTVVASRNEPAETKRVRNNLRAVLLLRAGQRFQLIAPILVPFFAHFGQDMQQIFFAGVVLCADHFADGNTLRLLCRSVWAGHGTAGGRAVFGLCLGYR